MIIVKVGGGKDIRWDYICEDIAALLKKGEKLIVVHGANAKRDEIAKELGVPTKYITSPSGVTSVYTNEKAIEILLMVYCGLVNKKIVANLQKYGINAVGLSGVDGKIWQAKRKHAVYAVENGKTILLRDNLVGQIEITNTGLIQILLDSNYLPVLTIPAISFEGEIVNVDNDFAVAVMAHALGVKKIVSLFEAPGLLRVSSDEASTIHSIKKEELDDYMQFAKGRMKKKILGAKKALQHGVEAMYWGDGRKKNPIQNAVDGRGTVIS